MGVRHKFQSVKPDGADPSYVQSSHWNDLHTVLEGISLGGYVVLTNVGASYDTIAPARGLGFVERNWAGVTEIVFSVMVNKVGTGAQRWQLWNETDGVDVGVIVDSGAAGNKALSVTITAGLPTGVKRLRVRALSSVAADDPVYYGASLQVTS